MRIIDKNTDFYDYLQNIYRDNTLTFDRTDSFLLTKKIFCDHLYRAMVRSRWDRGQDKYRFVLLQVCNSFWLFLVEVLSVDKFERPTDYAVELIAAWKNYNKSRCLIRLDVVAFGLNTMSAIRQDRLWQEIDRSKIFRRQDVLIAAIDQNDFDVKSSIDKHTIYRGDDTQVEKHIPLLKASGLAKHITPLDIYLAFEEYFSLEKSSSERTESTGLTNDEKIGNHGFDTKTSFRGK